MPDCALHAPAGAVARERPKASPGGSCRRRKAVTDEGKTCTNSTDYSIILLLVRPSSDLASLGHLPPGEGF